MKDNKNQPAFPQPQETDIDGFVIPNWQGLSKREYVIIKTFQTLLKDTDSGRIINESNDALLKKIVTASVKAADELLKQFEK